MDCRKACAKRGHRQANSARRTLFVVCHKRGDTGVYLGPPVWLTGTGFAAIDPLMTFVNTVQQLRAERSWNHDQGFF